MLLRYESDTKFLDAILRPIKSWESIFCELPKRQWAVHVSFSGIVAAALAMLVIGGIPYHRLLDWGIKAPAKQDLVGAIASMAEESDDDKTLEEAVEEFAGRPDFDDKKKKKKKPAPLKRQEEDCLILGYQANDEGLIYSLMLAAEFNGHLHYAGSVSLRLPLEELREISDRLAAHRAKRPFVKALVEGAEWVKPKFLCRVSYLRKGKQGGLYQAEFETMLSEVNLPEE